MLAPAMPDWAARATSRRWDAQDKLGVKVALPGLEEPVLWLDTILPLVRISHPYIGPKISPTSECRLNTAIQALQKAVIM